MRAVSLNLKWGAGAFLRRVGGVTAGAGVHGSRQHEAGRVGQGGQGPRDGDLAVFQRLPEDLQDVPLEFGQLVQEQDAVVREAHLAWPRNGAATDEASIGDRMVR